MHLRKHRGRGGILPSWNVPMCGRTTTTENLRALEVVWSGGDAHAAKLILVILLVEDVPLLAAFQDFFFLRSDSLAHFQFDLLFLFERGGQNLHHLLANGVAVVDEFHFFAGDKHFGDLVRQPYDFFSREAHRWSKSSYDLDTDCLKHMMQIRHSPKPPVTTSAKMASEGSACGPSPIVASPSCTSPDKRRWSGASRPGDRSKSDALRR